MPRTCSPFWRWPTRKLHQGGGAAGVSQSALSQNIRHLEERLGLRLLARTTRRVAPTEAGERLRRSIAPRFREIEADLRALTELRDKPAGRLRITATEYAADTVLLPKLAALLPEYPDIEVEIAVDYGLTDIVGEHYDAGVRLGEQVEKDMIAVRIGPDVSMAVVAAPPYFDARSRPTHPNRLTEHNCINLRLPTHGGTYAWEFEKDGRELNVHVRGQLVLGGATQMLHAAKAGLGWPMCRRNWRDPICVPASWSACWRTGARPSPAIIFTTRTGGRRRGPSPWWWRRCANKTDKKARQAARHKVARLVFSTSCWRPRTRRRVPPGRWWPG